MTEANPNPNSSQTEVIDSWQHEYHQLQVSYFQLEDENRLLAQCLKTTKWQRKWLIMLLLMIGIGAGGYCWRAELLAYLPNYELITIQFATPLEEEPEIPEIIDGKTLVIKTQLFQEKLSLIGKIEPLDQMEVISPLEGPIKEKHFEYGELVKQGQILLVIDTTKEKVNYRETSSTYIKSQQQVHKLQNWQTDPEVTVARRNLLKAQYSLEATQRELVETQRLFEKGIVPASELDNLTQQIHNQKLDYQTMQEQLQQILEKGSEANLRIAKLDMKNAQFRKQEIEQRIKNARVVSPIDGVVLAPIQRDEDTITDIQRGSFVKQEQVLFTIANMAGFLIKAKVDEVEIPKLQINQKVSITGDAFENITLEGAIIRISSQADKDTRSSDKSASLFPVTIAVKKLTAAQKKHLLLGMSTKMSVILSEKTDAILVPFKAVTTKGKKTWVNKINPETEKPERIEVTTGLTTIDTIEIIEGLKAGDELVVENSPN
jgi:RND family efflux transporter MFP subunit